MPDCPGAKLIHYLSVHDLVWINSTITGQTLAFNFETLEQAMAAQYGYGNSRDVPAQASNFLNTLITRNPFAHGNLRTAYVSVIAFLTANGHPCQVDDAKSPDIIHAVAAGTMSAAGAVAALSSASGGEGGAGASLRSLVTQICNEHSDALKELSAGDGGV